MNGDTALRQMLIDGGMTKEGAALVVKLVKGDQRGFVNTDVVAGAIQGYACMYHLRKQDGSWGKKNPSHPLIVAARAAQGPQADPGDDETMPIPW